MVPYMRPVTIGGGPLFCPILMTAKGAIFVVI